MKIVVINFSGNVGKSTIAGQLLKPRLPGATVYSVESLNVDAAADGVEVERLKGKKFGALLEQLALLDSAVIDVGAFNVEEFLRLMQQYRDSHLDFDLFVVPVVNKRKQQQDTMNTVRALAAIGVPANKIRVLFNNVDAEDDVVEEFAALFGLHQSTHSFRIHPGATVYANEVFDLIKGTGRSIDDVVNDTVDYRQKLKRLTDEAERQACVRMLSIKRLAATASLNLDTAYAALIA